MNFPRELRTRVLWLTLATLTGIPARGLVVFNDGHDHIYVTGTVAIGADSNIFGNNQSDGDTVYSASLLAEYTRRAGWIGVNASLELETTRFGSNSGENFTNPRFASEFTKLSGRTKGSLTLSAARENRADPNVNQRSESWNYGAGLNATYPVIDRYSLVGGLNYSRVDYTDNGLFVDQRSFSANADLFYVLTQDRDLTAGYRYRDNQSSLRTGSIDHAFMLGVSGRIVRGYTGSLRFGYQYHLPKNGRDETVRTWTGSATVAHSFTKKLTLSARADKDFSTTANNIDVDKTAASLDLQHAFNARWNVHGGLGYGRVRFLGRDGIIASLDRRRIDTFFNASAGVGYSMNQHLKVSLDYNWMKNWSTLAYSDFIRRSWSLTVTSAGSLMKTFPSVSPGRWCLLAAALVCASVAAAQTPAGGKKSVSYRISITDKLGISVVGEEELTVVSRVDAKGFINLKFLGEVPVYGLTISDAQKAVETAYREGRYLVNPQVTITIEDYAPRPVTITGEVKNPNRYSMPPESSMSVRDLVSMAGGFTDSAKGTEVKITRVYLDGTKKVFVVDVQSLMKGKAGAKAEDSEFLLEPNDLVFVPIRLI